MMDEWRMDDERRDHKKPKLSEQRYINEQLHVFPLL